MSNLRFVRRQLQERVETGSATTTETYRTVIKLILQERHMDGMTEIWEDVPIEDEKC